MKRNSFFNILFIAVLVSLLLFMLSPATKDIFNNLTTEHPFWMAFGKFLILASMGELLGIRIQMSRWELPKGFMYKVILWGFYGMIITLGMKIFSSGTGVILDTGYLPVSKNVVTLAFFTSLFHNTIFSPVFMTVHKFIDTRVDFFVEGSRKPTLSNIIERVDWETHYGFVVMKTIPFFWIPVHTLVFMMPEVYRVISAAFLSIILGMILAIAKKKKNETSSISEIKI